MTKYFILVFIFSNQLNAFVVGHKPADRIQLGRTNAIEFCWNGIQDQKSKDLRYQIEKYVENELARANLSIHFWNAPCLELEDPFFPVGIVFYDDPLTDMNSLHEYSGMISSFNNKGHPRAIAGANSVHLYITDLIMTSRGGEVNRWLEKQFKKLSATGKLNLLKSIFLHEILHTLGAKHEQRHSESTCEFSSDANNKIIRELTVFDENSVMNYCKTRRYDYETKPIPLSTLDIEGLKKHFGL